MELTRIYSSWFFRKAREISQNPLAPVILFSLILYQLVLKKEEDQTIVWFWNTLIQSLLNA